MRQGVSPSHIWLLLFLFLFSISCKSKKYVFEGVDQKIDPSEIDSIIMNHNIDFEWYAAKAKFKFESKGISESGTAYLRVKKDSVIWMALKKFSIEGLRLQMTPDSFTIIDRINKYVVSMDWYEMRAWYRMPIDFSMMQGLVVGNVTYRPDHEKDIDGIDTSAYHVTQKAAGLSYTYRVPYFEQRIESFSMEDVFNRLLKVKYENCSTAEEYCFSRVYTISSQEAQEIYLSLKLSDLELNKAKNLKFDIPPHYTRL